MEDAINLHDDVVESAVVGYPHNIKGQGIYAYVNVKEIPGNSEEFNNTLRKQSEKT